MMTIMAAFGQLERDTMIERTRAGLAARPTTATAGGPAKWTMLLLLLLLPGPGNSKARPSVPQTSARCSESPAPRSTDTSHRRRGEKPRSDDDIEAARSTLVIGRRRVAGRWR